MCSHDAVADLVADKVRSVAGVSAVVVELPVETDPRFTFLETSQRGKERPSTHGNLSSKRNLGLLLGQLAGWRTVIFLDDDICGLETNAVQSAAKALSHHAAVGMPAVDFPDNSVVCHANRRASRRQDVFVSGSALAVDLAEAETFFPEIYNEDWLFLAPLLDRKAVSAFGSVSQLGYAPFEDISRAGDQEFGEVVAEGLVGYLHSAELNPLPKIDYWKAFLESRSRFISHAMLGCEAKAGSDEEAGAAVSALKSAQEALARIEADVVEDYVAAWSRDLVAWRSYMRTHSPVNDLTDAMKYLGLRGEFIPARRHPRPPERSGKDHDRRPPNPAQTQRLCPE
ncbi:hypothetical protein Ato02nite_097270 [Paractinoplanes toevensis]|uniref:Uncharacterized protein n=2 Tax=Paractinoplanes toevensis TaxID=571911 RepID=A0A920BR22_9ACTN|nr:hypothetical protein Ato02nite_097270 [Actinoplanes toevensis]